MIIPFNAERRLNYYVRLSSKLGGTFIASAVAFCVGAWIGGAWYERRVLPDVLKKYPHDGQVGLAVAGAMIAGALVCAVIVLIVGVVLTVRTSKRPKTLPLNPQSISGLHP